MAIYSVFVLALVQAITEFLPVSSSGHLIILREITDIETNLAVDVMLHMGTLLALIVYYRKKLLSIYNSLVSNRKSQLFNNIVVSSIPAIIIGLLFDDALSGDIRSIGVVIVMLGLVGSIMLFEEQLLPKKVSRKFNNLSWQQAFGIGVAQTMALIPGTSRSGASIIGGRLSGLNNKDSADYAFLIGIPVIFGAGVKVLFESEAREFITTFPFDVAFGVTIAAIFGWLAIDFVLRLLKKVGLKWFGAYRIALALVLLIWI
jgi:undecaprenyl-diphosphatase